MTYQEFLDSLSELFGFTITTLSFIFITIFIIVVIILVIVNLRMFFKRKSVQLFFSNLIKKKNRQVEANKKILKEKKMQSQQSINNTEQQAPTIGNMVETVVREHMKSIIIPYLDERIRKIELSYSKPKYNQQQQIREENEKPSAVENFFIPNSNFEIQNREPKQQDQPVQKQPMNKPESVNDIKGNDFPLYQTTQNPVLQESPQAIEENYDDGGFPIEEEKEQEKGEYDDLKWNKK